MKKVVIFSENHGWHEQELAAAFERRGAAARVASLRDCRIAPGQGPASLHVPGWDGALPDGALVRSVGAGSFEEVTFRLTFLHALRRCGVPVCNDAGAIERTVDKGMTSFLLMQHRVPAPPAWVCENAAAAHQVIREQRAQGRALVQKPLFGNCGRGLRLIDAADYQLDAALINGVYYLQQFIDQADRNGRDWRVFVINHRPVAAMERVSEHWVTNRARGGRCLPAALTPPLRRLAAAASRATGIGYGGIDLIRDGRGDCLVLEVNSVPAWRGLQSVCSVDIADLLAGSLLEEQARAPAR